MRAPLWSVKLLAVVTIAGLLVSNAPPLATPRALAMPRPGPAAAFGPAAPVAAPAPRVLSTVPVDSPGAPHPTPPPPSLPAKAPIASPPSNTFPATLLLPTAGATPGGVWSYSAAGWVLKNGRINGQATSTSLPAGIYWLWIAADPLNRDRWLLLGNSHPFVETFSRVAPGIVKTADQSTSPLWYTEDAGAHWHPITLRDALGTPNTTSYRFEGVEFATTNTGSQVTWFLTGMREDSWLLTKESTVWRGNRTESGPVIINSQLRDSRHQTAGVAGDVVIGTGNEGQSQFGYLPAGSNLVTLVGAASLTHLWVDRLPGTSKAVVGLNVGDPASSSGLYATSDYQTTMPTERIHAFLGGSLSVATHGIYIGDRAAGGILQVTDIFNTTPSSSVVVGAGVQTGFVRVVSTAPYDGGGAEQR